MNLKNKNSFGSGIFDLIRFLAALTIVSGHVASRFFGPFKHNYREGNHIHGDKGS